MKEIKTLEEFTGIRERGLGFVLITDMAGGNHIHSADCRDIREDHFTKKVVDGSCEFGNYYLIDDVDGVMRSHNAELCKRCMKERGSSK